MSRATTTRASPQNEKILQLNSLARESTWPSEFNTLEKAAGDNDVHPEVGKIWTKILFIEYMQVEAEIPGLRDFGSTLVT